LVPVGVVAATTEGNARATIDGVARRRVTSDEDGGVNVDDVARDRDRSTRTTATSTTTTIWECRVLGVIGRAARARTMGERDVEYGIGRSRARVCSSTSRVVIYFS